MTTRGHDPYEDPQQYDDLWGDTENFPGHMVNPPEADEWHPRRSAGAWLAVVGVAVLVWSVVIYVAVQGGWPK